MSSNVLFDASSIGLFHECSSLLLKKKDFLYFISHKKKKKKQIWFFKAFYKSRSFHLQNRSGFFFTYKPKTNFFIVLFYFVSKQILFFYIKIKNQFFYSQKWFLNFFFFFNKEKDAFINKFMWLSLVKCFTYATYHSYHA